MRLAPTVALLLLAVSCGGAQRHTERGHDGVVRVAGRVTYGARREQASGLSPTEEMRPARWVALRLLDAAGTEVGRGRTNAAGDFAIDGAGAVRVEVAAHAELDGLDVSTAHDSGGREIHTYAASVTAPLGAPAHAPFETGLEIEIRDGETEMAGALHIVDTILRGLERVRDWTGETLPSVYVYWGRGVTTDWSYYRGEMPAGSGRFCLELLGGQPGQQASTDTDEHDEAIMLHELGHFVMDRLSGDSSIGGMHPRGVLVDPGVAWEEGRATWFATAVLGLPFYRDTIGIAPDGSTRVDENLETPQQPRGLGSETSVAGILWDLSDGAEAGPAGASLLDGDDDGVALGPAAVLTAMITQAHQPGSFASIGSFLHFLTQTGVVETSALSAMLGATGEPASILPSDEVSTWPVDVAVGETARGVVDGITNPAPSGGGARPDNGFDAIRTFRVHVPSRGMLDVQLVIAGSGSSSDHTDLDLELRDIRAHVLDRTTGATARQAVVDLVAAGDYVVYVRDAGTGNRAEFEISVAFTSVEGRAID